MALPSGGFAPLVPELDVTDIDISLRFWCAVLGFMVAYDRPKSGFAFLQWPGDGLTAQIMLCRRNGHWETASPERPFGRGINFQFHVAAITPILNRLAAANWPLFRDAADAWYRAGDQETGCREFLVQDPDGYLLRFSEDLGLRPAH